MAPNAADVNLFRKCEITPELQLCEPAPVFQWYGFNPARQQFSYRFDHIILQWLAHHFVLYTPYWSLNCTQGDRFSWCISRDNRFRFHMLWRSCEIPYVAKIGSIWRWVLETFFPMINRDTVVNIRDKNRSNTITDNRKMFMHMYAFVKITKNLVWRVVNERFWRSTVCGQIALKVHKNVLISLYNTGDKWYELTKGENWITTDAFPFSLYSNRLTKRQLKWRFVEPIF